MYNKIVMVGNLTRDLELRYSQSGMAIGNTAIATSRKFTKNNEKCEEVCFVDITFFARSAEIANQYLRKGSKILVEGRLNFDQWVDQNGQKRSKHSVVVETMQMLDTKGDGQQQQQPQQQPSNYQKQQPSNYQKQQNYQQPSTYDESKPQQSQSMDYDGKPIAQEMPKSSSVPVIDIDEDEIPFAPIGLQYPMSLFVM